MYTWGRVEGYTEAHKGVHAHMGQCGGTYGGTHGAAWWPIWRYTWGSMAVHMAVHMMDHAWQYIWRYTCLLAEHGDLVALAGHGHEGGAVNRAVAPPHDQHLSALGQRPTAELCGVELASLKVLLTLARNRDGGVGGGQRSRGVKTAFRFLTCSNLT